MLKIDLRLNLLYLMFLTLILVSSQHPVLAQERVGINTSSPLFSLDVRGMDDPVGSTLQLSTPSQSNFIRLFSGSTLDKNPVLTFHELDTFHIATALADGSNFARRITLLPTGNTGIGTDNPLARLDIAASGDGVEIMRLSTERPWVFKQRDSGINTRLSLQSTVNGKAFDILAEDGITRLAEFYALNSAGKVVLVPDFGRVGIGIDAPDAKLDIRNNLFQQKAIYAEDTSATQDNIVVHARVTGPFGTALLGQAESVSGGTGVKGMTSSLSGVGVYAHATAATGSSKGVHARMDSDQGIGIFAEATSATGQTHGIWASNASVEGTGMYAVATATTGSTKAVLGWNYSNDGVGVQGIASSSSGPNRGLSGITYSSQGIGVIGHATSNTGTTYGMYSTSVSSAGTGAYAQATSPTGTTYGVRALSTSNSGYGVFGQANATSGTTYGVYGNAASTSGTGVYGVVSATSGSTRGVSGISYSPAGVGVIGQANNSSGTNYGVHGISTSSSGRGVYGEATSGSGTTFGVYGKVSSDGTGVFGENTSSSGPSTGVWGKSVSTSGIGVYGSNSATTGTNYGVWGTTPSTSGTGVYGIANATTGTTNGVYGNNLSDSGRGVYGNASGESGKALYGYATGIYGKGLHAVATGTHSSVNAILAEANQGSAYAGYFVGRVHVAGALSKSSGSFKIDHPQDPANKYLYHSFVESPDMMNIYNGNIFTDADGYAVVELPAYFDALNMDFRYQLTVVGVFAQAIIAEKIENNKFTIRTDKPNVEVSWMVTGIRKDPWAEANRIEPEVMKESENRGKYITPEVYGQPETARINYQPKL